MSDDPNIYPPNDFQTPPDFEDTGSHITPLNLGTTADPDVQSPVNIEPPANHTDHSKPGGRRPSFGQAILVILLASISLLALLYLGTQLWDLPFPPFELYRWLLHVEFPSWVTLSEALIGTSAINVEDLTQRTLQAQWVMGLSLYFLLALTVGLIFTVWVRRREQPPDLIGGLVAGLLLAAPLIFVCLAATDSLQPDLLVAAWLAGMCMIWGIAISYAFAQVRRTPFVEPVPGQTPEGIDRRQFLLQFGAGAAAITAISGAAATAIAPGKDAAQLRRTLPMISPELLEAERELFGHFRRFAIIRSGVATEEESNVLALGAEYPDRNYVSIWIGDRSPIMVYENLDSALAAYSTEDSPAVAHWLDD